MDRLEPRAAGRFWGIRPPLCPPQACGQLPPGFLALILGPTMGLVAGRGNRGSVLIFFGMNKIITAYERERHTPLRIFLLSPLFPTCLYCHNFPTSLPGIYYSLWRNKQVKDLRKHMPILLSTFPPQTPASTICHPVGPSIYSSASPCHQALLGGPSKPALSSPISEVMTAQS